MKNTFCRLCLFTSSFCLLSDRKQAWTQLSYLYIPQKLHRPLHFCLIGTSAGFRVIQPITSLGTSFFRKMSCSIIGVIHRWLGTTLAKILMCIHRDKLKSGGIRPAIFVQMAVVATLPSRTIKSLA